MTTKAAPIMLFIVRITTKTLHPTVTIGAVYWNEQAAIDEVARLNAANSYTSATYVARQAEWPTCFKREEAGPAAITCGCCKHVYVSP